MNHQPRIFISSVQKELAPERRALVDFIKGDPLVQRYFDVFLFEDVRRKGVLNKIGTTGRGTFYVLARYGDKKETKGTSNRSRTKGT